MSTDLSAIRLSLQDCEEIKLPYKFPRKCWIKYITLHGDDEAFYEGGEFVRMGNHKLILKENKRTFSVPTIIRADDGDILYRSRFFINPNYNPSCEKDKQELSSIVTAQQEVILKNAKQIKILEDRCLDLNNDNHTTRIELEEVKYQLKEAMIREKKYKLILTQYM